jgi:hypothetical protein
MSMMLGPGLLEGVEGGDAVYISATGALYEDSGYVSGSAGVTLDVPARDAGDLLVAMVASDGGISTDTNGNWTTYVSSGGDHYRMYYKTATGDSGDNYTMAASSVGSAASERRAQIICIKAVGGTAAYLEKIGEESTGGTLRMSARTNPVGSTTNILEIAVYWGRIEGASPLSTDTPYGVQQPSLTSEIGEDTGYGYLQPNPRYWVTGWAWRFEASSSTAAAEELTHKPSIGTYTYVTTWFAFYKSP